MERCFVLLHNDIHWHELIPEPYLSIVTLVLVIALLIYIAVKASNIKASRGKNKSNPDNYVSDEQFMASLIAAKRKREDERYVGKNSTAIPKQRDDSEESIWKNDMPLA